jgi:non-ribosomal peptide synthase protein (TIGR01720 family)
MRFFRTASGVWQPFISEVDDEIPLTVEDLSSLSTQRQREAIETRAVELQTSLNLADGPLLRLAHFDLGQERASYLLLIVHHLVIDAISWPILSEDLMTLLRQARAGQPVRLPPKTSSFKQWAERLRQHADSEMSETERRYWLNGRRLDVARLPRDYAEGVNDRASGQELVIVLSEQDTRGVQSVARSTQSGTDELLLAALGLALVRWTRWSRVLINVERHGREDLSADLNFSRTVGWFANITPVLLELPEEAPPSKVFQAAREQLRAIPNRGIGYGLLRYLGSEEVRSHLSDQPQAEVFLNYFGQRRGGERQAREFDELQPGFGPLQSRQGLRRHAIEINAVIQHGQLQLRWSFSTNLHNRSTIEKLAQEFTIALQEFVEDGQLAKIDSHHFQTSLAAT